MCLLGDGSHLFFNRFLLKTYSKDNKKTYNLLKLGMSRQDGFLMARAAALKLQSQGIHLIPVCFTSPCQTGELLGVASYPKLQTAIMEKDIKEASTIAVRVADDYLEGKLKRS